MRSPLDRNRVSGFLHADGMKLRNGREEEVLLIGWGLGNWMLCEGYMWKLGDFEAFDRPRRIERTIADLAGEKYAARFWKLFHALYITEQDIRMMAEMGCNSLRVPISARLFLGEGPGVSFREEGFEMLDALLSWCEKYGLYCFIDMHGAPGGQTGANIDDSPDDLCHLLMEDSEFERGLALWEEIARRYHDRWIVGGYDLLNEPIRPVRREGDQALEAYEPRLRDFYTQAIARIRAVDSRHMIALEGIHWATDPGIFDHVYDPQMMIHFHRYWCAPERSELETFLSVGRRLNAPLWLGETGENTLPWIAAMAHVALEAGISVTLWPWKKMDTDNSPLSVRPPEGWDMIRKYLSGGTRPDAARVQTLLNRYLENIRAENCVRNGAVMTHALRCPPTTLWGTDFDAIPGISWHREGTHEAGVSRKDTGMETVALPETEHSAPPTDGPWSRAALRLHPGEWARYTFFNVFPGVRLEITCLAGTPSRLEIRQGEELLDVRPVSGCAHKQVLSGLRLRSEQRCILRLTALEGTIDIVDISADLIPEY